MTRRWSWWRLALVPLGVGIGAVLAITVPSHAAVVMPFDSLPLQQLVRSPNDQVYNGGFWRSTLCGAAKAVHLPPKTELECQEGFRSAGFGELRIDAPTLREAQRARRTLVTVLDERLYGARFHPASTDVGRPTWSRTAPVWAGVGCLLLALFCPLPGRRRTGRRAPPDAVLVPA